MALIDRTTDLLKEIGEFQAMPDGPEKQALDAVIRGKIREYNRDQLKTVRSQQRPIDMGFAAQQWFDTEEAFAKVMPQLVGAGD